MPAALGVVGSAGTGWSRWWQRGVEGVTLRSRGLPKKLKKVSPAHSVLLTDLEDSDWKSTSLKGCVSGASGHAN